MLNHTLTIGDMSQRAGVAASTLRFYEERGLIKSERTSGNQRRYARAELRRVAFIRTAQRVGLSLEEVHAALRELPEGRTPTKADWARLSRLWHARLTAQIATLEKLRDDLTGCIGCGCLSLRGCTLYNPRDALSADGPGPRMWLDGEEES